MTKTELSRLNIVELKELRRKITFEIEDRLVKKEEEWSVIYNNRLNK